MTEFEVRTLLESLKEGECSIDDATQRLKSLSVEDLGYAKLDHHRSLRNGFPEVIYAEGKTPLQVVSIFKALLSKNDTVMATRALDSHYKAVLSEIPTAKYDEMSRIIFVTPKPVCTYQESIDNKRNAHDFLVEADETNKTNETNKINATNQTNNVESDLKDRNYVAVCAAGTSDLPVAEEAVLTTELMGFDVERVYDIGVAGLNRLLSCSNKFLNADVIICVAGMEGALASVVGGLTDKPLIAVPTSVGYGANFGGVSALLTMLNSCASGVGVVNIDNGFGAAHLAASIMRLVKGKNEK